MIIKKYFSKTYCIVTGKCIVNGYTVHITRVFYCTINWGLNPQHPRENATNFSCRHGPHLGKNFLDIFDVGLEPRLPYILRVKY